MLPVVGKTRDYLQTNKQTKTRNRINIRLYPEHRIPKKIEDIWEHRHELHTRMFLQVKFPVEAESTVFEPSKIQ